MAYSREPEDRIDRIADAWGNLDKRKMFGGIGYLIRGNMCFGIYRDFLVVRTGPGRAEELLRLENARPFDVTGRTMKGWIMVNTEGTAGDRDLRHWLHTGRKFASSLPEK